MDKVRSSLYSLFKSEAVIDVVNGKNVPRAKPLDEEALGQIFGREATAG